MQASRESRRRLLPGRLQDLLGSWTAAAWIARLVTLTGFVDVVQVVLPPARHRLQLIMELVPLGGVQTARAATVAVGLLLMYLGTGLHRGKREAWLLASVLAGVGVGLNVVKGFDVDSAALSGAVVVLLVTTRDQFRAVADPVSRWRAVGACAAFSAAGLMVGVAEIAVRSQRLVGHPPVHEWVAHAALGMLGLDGPLRFTAPSLQDTVALTTGTMGLLAVAVPLALLLRPGPRRAGQSAEDELRLRMLLQRYGSLDSLGYFSLRQDKSVCFSRSGKAAIAYRVVSGVSLAAGDPIGDPEAWPAAIGAWLHESRRNGWTPAVLGCGERAGQVYRRHGLDAIELGDEAIIDVPAFELDGRAMRSVRQAVARVARAGYRCAVARQRDLPADQLAAARHAAKALRDGTVERGFSMALSRVGDPADPENVLVLAWDSGGRLRGLLQFVPWGTDGLSLDTMRRDRNADNGLIEFMVVATLQAAAELGVCRVSLNFAILRSVFERANRIGAGPVLRAWHWLLVLASRFWQIESLYRANAKYQPGWRPRFLCLPTLRHLPRVGFAALRAEAFVVTPASLAQLTARLARPFRRHSERAEDRLIRTG
ncbi:MAG TPA: phosphatidylglycerol lysyltransferase domain-containing protein [Micromonosporaceae bacterium]